MLQEFVQQPVLGGAGFRLEQRFALRQYLEHHVHVREGQLFRFRRQKVLQCVAFTASVRVTTTTRTARVELGGVVTGLGGLVPMQETTTTATAPAFQPMLGDELV